MGKGNLVVFAHFILGVPGKKRSVVLPSFTVILTTLRSRNVDRSPLFPLPEVFILYKKAPVLYGKRKKTKV